VPSPGIAMAELGVAANIFGVASFGIEVAQLLYAAGDVLVHAHGQIARLAKNVTQFTAVLRQVGRVLETDGKGVCSEELLREIRHIVHSSRGTLRQIKETTRSRLAKPWASVRWLFKRSKASELEARLESQKSTLQIMMHTVTVSKLGQMHDR
jgi:hypothetical protein